MSKNLKCRKYLKISGSRSARPPSPSPADTNLRPSLLQENFEERQNKVNMDFYKAVGVVTAGVAGGAVELVKAVAETTVDIGKGIVEGYEDATVGADSAYTGDEKLDAIVDVITKPLAGGLTAGRRGTGGHGCSWQQNRSFGSKQHTSSHGSSSSYHHSCSQSDFRNSLKRCVFSRRLKTVSDSAVLTSSGSSFHHLGASTEKSLDVCFLCVLSDGGSSRAVLEALRALGADLALTIAIRSARPPTPPPADTNLRPSLLQENFEERQNKVNMDFFKAVGAISAGVAGGAVELTKAVVETTVDVSKGIVGGVEGAMTGDVNNVIKPLAGGLTAGCNRIVKAPVKVVSGVHEGVKAVLD
ncbi:hypothetical protein AMEX_G24558 [Astyanax mexicanus]|uniref:Uncharacterized protein n=1 Tax=Astyanax mexicanus TaxID=7994 RepID=A0A8T2L0A9_ASTMX|nr:hypothetical protein AMEX_G24558 [Astyanax mexicanus]